MCASRQTEGGQVAITGFDTTAPRLEDLALTGATVGGAPWCARLLALAGGRSLGLDGSFARVCVCARAFEKRCFEADKRGFVPGLLSEWVFEEVERGGF